MNRRDVSLTFALCASLVLHAALSFAIAEAYVRGTGERIWLPGLSRAAPAEAEAPQRQFDLDEDPRRRLGDAGGAGYAIDESPGARPMLARDGALDQPLLSRDPVGHGRVGDEPSEWTLPPGDAGTREPKNLPAPAFASAGDARAVGVAPPREASSVSLARPEARVDVNEANETGVATAHEPSAPFASPAPPVPQGAIAMKSPVPPPPAATDTDGADAASPGSPTAADPAPRGESELDPVAVAGAMDFRTGSTTVRAGRKHKLVRPRLTLDAKLDLVSLGSTYVVLRLRLDAGGNVTSCEIARSSGSESVDQVIKVTSYEWWFDPARDASNRPVPDSFQFIVRIN